MTLQRVDEVNLEALLLAAAAGAEPGETMPAVPGPPGWTAQRRSAFRSYHRDRFGGLDAPPAELTFAVMVNTEPVGVARLARSDAQHALEAGLWLTREARGRGVGGDVLRLLRMEAACGRVGGARGDHPRQHRRLAPAARRRRHPGDTGYGRARARRTPGRGRPVNATDVSELDAWIRLHVYERLAAGEPAPTPLTLAAAFHRSPAEVEQVLHRLQRDHDALVLLPGSPYVWMAEPFSAVPTSFEVAADDGRRWWGNCIWDALAILALVGADGTVRCACPDCGDPLEVRVEEGRPREPVGVAHFAIPAGEWWRSIGFT